MKKTSCYRALFYVLGLLILALGLTLNTKAGLGVSPIISVSYSVSQIFSLNFGDTTLVLYCIFVLVELVLHLTHGRAGEGTPGSRRLTLLLDVLQIPLSLCLAGQLVGVGIGTVVGVIGVGRVIALFHHLTGKRIGELSGLTAARA